jgi:hypothetical protein
LKEAYFEDNPTGLSMPPIIYDCSKEKTSKKYCHHCDWKYDVTPQRHPENMEEVQYL